MTFLVYLLRNWADIDFFFFFIFSLFPSILFPFTPFLSLLERSGVEHGASAATTFSYKN